MKSYNAFMWFLLFTLCLSMINAISQLPWTTCDPPTSCFRKRTVQCKIGNDDVIGLNCVGQNEPFEEIATTGCDIDCIANFDWNKVISTVIKTCNEGSNCFDSNYIQQATCSSNSNCYLQRKHRCYDVRTCGGNPDVWTPTGSLSQCSVTCGGGTQTRERVCWDIHRNQPGTRCTEPNITSITYPCNTQPCPTWSSWTEVTSCINGFITFQSNCTYMESASTLCTGSDASSIKEEKKPCNTAQTGESQIPPWIIAIIAASVVLFLLFGLGLLLCLLRKRKRKKRAVEEQASPVVIPNPNSVPEATYSNTPQSNIMPHSLSPTTLEKQREQAESPQIIVQENITSTSAQHNHTYEDAKYQVPTNYLYHTPTQQGKNTGQVHLYDTPESSNISHLPTAQRTTYDKLHSQNSSAESNGNNGIYSEPQVFTDDGSGPGQFNVYNVPDLNTTLPSTVNEAAYDKIHSTNLQIEVNESHDPYKPKDHSSSSNQYNHLEAPRDEKTRNDEFDYDKLDLNGYTPMRSLSNSVHGNPIPGVVPSASDTDTLDDDHTNKDNTSKQAVTRRSRRNRNANSSLTTKQFK